MGMLFLIYKASLGVHKYRKSLILGYDHCLSDYIKNNIPIPAASEL